MGVTLPYTITNGTPHDAVPVQRNFEALRDGHNAHVHDGVDTPKVNFADVDGKPATYPPSAHAASHAQGGADPVDAASVDGFHAAATATANKLLALNAEAKLPASITGDAETVDGAHAGTGANNVLKLDANGKVPLGNLPTVPAARVYHSAHQSIPNATATILSFDSESFDTDNIHDPATNNDRLTCRTAGKYLITANVVFGSNATGYRTVTIVSSVKGTIAQVTSVALNGDTSMCVSTLCELAVNEYLRVQVYQDSGGSQYVRALPNYSPVFSMVWVG